MVFSRIKSTGWATNERLQSAQMNQLDLDHSHAIDKTGETAASGGGVSGEIEFLPISTLVFDGYSGCTFQANSSLSVSGSANIATGGNLTWNSGAVLDLARGSSATCATTLTFPDGYSVASFGSASQLKMNTGSVATFDNVTIGLTDYTVMTVGANASIVTPGQNIIINDTTNPTYGSTRSRNVSQPLIVNPYNGAPISFNLNGTFNDSVSSSYSYLLPCTKVLNGATITNVYVYYQTGSTAPTTSTPSNVGLYKLNNATNTASQIGSTVFVPSSGLSGNTQYYLAITGLTEVVADNGTTYFVKVSTVSGSGAQSLTWYPVQIYFTGISYVGQT